MGRARVEIQVVSGASTRDASPRAASSDATLALRADDGGASLLVPAPIAFVTRAGLANEGLWPLTAVHSCSGSQPVR